MATIIQLRRDTASNWTTNNPTLAQGEIGVELVSNKFKIGDGTSTWTGLSYFTGTTLGANVATFLATPTSANLIAAVTDETGTGSLVFSNSPTLVTPLLGTPASGNLSNCTFPVASTTVSGAVKVDGTTVTISSGVISAAGGIVFGG